MKKKPQQPTPSKQPQQKQPRQMTLLESLALVDPSDAPAKQKRQPTGSQRKLENLSKVVKRSKETPEETMTRNIAVLEEYREACEREHGGGGGGGGEGGRAGNDDDDEGAATSAASEPHHAQQQQQQQQQQEERARLALRELSCVRIDSALVASTGAGHALRAFRRSPYVALLLSMQADRILEVWKQLVTSEVRAKRKYEKAHAASSVP